MVRRKDDILDSEDLMKRLDNDSELLREIVSLFEEQSVELVRDIKIAIAQQDAKKLRFIAHKLKGSARTLCATKTCEAAQVLEDLGMTGNLTSSGLALADLELALQETAEALRTLAAEFPS